MMKNEPSKNKPLLIGMTGQEIPADPDLWPVVKAEPANADPDLAGLTMADVTTGDPGTDLVRVYLHQIGAVSLLSAEKEVVLAKQIQAGVKAKEIWPKAINDPDELARLRQCIALGRQARRQLAEANLRLVVHVARHYSNRGMSFLDLIQEGNIGLLKAVEKFDPDRGYRFSTYATWWIRQAISRALADHGGTIRIPVHVRAAIIRLADVERRWLQETGREPSAREIALKLGFLSEDEVQAIERYRAAGMPLGEALEVRRREAIRKVRQIKRIPQEPESLDALLGPEDGSSLGEFVADESDDGPAATFAASSLKEHLGAALQQLNSQEREVLVMRFGLKDGQGRTLEEVGHEYGVTRERIRQIEARALRKLRHPMRNNVLKDYRH